MAVLIQCDGATRSIEPRNGSYFVLHEMQQYLGAYIEVVKVGDRWIVIKDASHADCLTVNARATMLARQHSVAEAIYGDVLLLEPEEYA